MSLTATQVGDLVQTTLRDLGKPKFTEIATNLQRHTAMSHLMDKNRVVITSGIGFQWDVMVSHSGAARNAGLADPDQVNIKDNMVQATADWRYTTTNYGIIGQTMDMNREPARIVDYVKQRRIDCMIGLAELMESNFWGPPVAITDTETPWGVNTWIVKNATEGFTGGAPSGYTTIGLNPSTYPRWKNYAGPYSAVTPDDLIRKWRKAARLTDWEPPVDGIPTFNTGNTYGFYLNYSSLNALEEILVAQNENLLNDLAPKDGQATFLRTPVTWVPYLDADTTNPVYGINWGDFKTYILSGWWLKETHLPNYPGNHTVDVHFLDSMYQFIARNRRTLFVLSNGTTYPG